MTPVITWEINSNSQNDKQIKKMFSSTNNKRIAGTSLVVQWLRAHVQWQALGVTPGWNPTYNDESQRQQLRPCSQVKYNVFKKKHNNNSSSGDNHCNGNTQHWQGCGIEKHFNNSIKIIITHFLENKSALKKCLEYAFMQ